MHSQVWNKLTQNTRYHASHMFIRPDSKVVTIGHQMNFGSVEIRQNVMIGGIFKNLQKKTQEKIYNY